MRVGLHGLTGHPESAIPRLREQRAPLHAPFELPTRPIPHVHLSLDSHEPAPPAGLPLYRQPDLRVFIADDEWPPELPGAGLLQALVEGLS